VDYLEAAPWNLKAIAERPRFLGVGTLLVAEAVRISAEAGFEGLVGLHSLAQAEGFYQKCQMTRVGEDPTYFELAYFEHQHRKALDWLSSIGETL
jgi:hypothetical protein